MDNRLGRTHWLNAARRALLHHGPDGVRVELLAKELGVTKGSFYWHFEDRNALLEALLREWEEETGLLLDALRAAEPRTALSDLFEELRRRSRMSERGDSPSDAAIFAWAAIDPRVARRANRAEKERMELFRKLTGNDPRADLFFYAYHGYLFRRRRVPEASADIEMILSLARETFVTSGKKSATRRIGRAAMALIGALVLAQGCTTYRIIRHREPSPDRTVRIFPQRAVAHAAAPFVFATGAQRSDLDTLSVRDVDGRLKPLAEYITARSIRAFLVIRDDTIVYEKYRDGYDSSTLSSSFSVAKSVTSSLLGLALEQGRIRSLDDPVTRYVPALAKNPDYEGVTIGHLLGMRSGFFYSRTNGSLWHDFRSSDAHFYHTTNLQRSLGGVRRETAPSARWSYKDSDTEAIGWVLSNATGTTVAEQTEAIWKRIGTQFDASWDLDHENGTEKVSSGLNATARDFARFGRLVLHEGNWLGEQVLPRDWVLKSTTLDTTRAEPEVATWYRMQHQRYWWIPMHNWPAERDFFADGSRGQRIYVHRPTRTIIVQLADDSDQEFPFRKIVHYLSGEPFRYPTPVPAVLLRAARAGATPDSLRALFDDLAQKERAQPALYVTNEAGLISVGQQLVETPATRSAGIAILELSVKRSPTSARSREALEAARRRSP